MKEIDEIISEMTAKDTKVLCREVMSITDTMDVLRSKWTVEILTAILCDNTVNLYDRNLNVKGCMSCFACKIKGGKKGVCSFKDDLQPILQKAVEADVLVCGSPNYCGYPTAGLRAFMERMEFPTVNYSDYTKPTVLKKIHSATIYTMNCPNEEFYKQMRYDILMDTNAMQLGVFGPTEILRVYDTYQFTNYDRYDAATFNPVHKAAVRDTQFPKDLEQAYELGKRLVKASEKA